MTSTLLWTVDELSLAQSEGVINTRPVCAPLLSGVQPCASRYVEGPSATRLANGDFVILVNAGYGGFNQPGSGEALHAIVYPNTPGVKPRWYPIYGSNNWAGNQSGNEHEVGFPSSLFLNGSWRTIYTQTFLSPRVGRDARIDAPSLTSQPAFRDPQWLTPSPPCTAFGSCPGERGSGLDMFVTASDGTAYDYRFEGGLCSTCPDDPQGPGYRICFQRTRIDFPALTGTAAGCISFPPGTNPYTPESPYDIGRGIDGAYYMLASHFPYQNFIGEWKSFDGLIWSYNNRLWQVNCQTVHDSAAAVDPDCAVRPSATNCFVSQGAYVRDSIGVIVEPRVVVGTVGNHKDAPQVDGSWRLYYWADFGAQLPATWGSAAAACPPPYVVPAGTPSYQGNFDGFSTNMQNASGWAWDWYQPNSVTDVSIYVDGTAFTTNPANLLRADLLNPPDPRYYYGNGIHGWNWPVASFFRDGLQHTVDVRYVGTQTSVSNSPRTYKVAAPSSVSVAPTTVIGGGTATLTINLSQAAPAPGLTVLLSSSDPAAAVPATKLITGATGTATVTTSVVAGVTNTTLRASSGTVTKSTVLAIGPSAPAYNGNFDGVNCDVATGWAWNANFPNTPISVTIKEGSTVIVSGLPANIFRQGLPGNGIHAFSFPVPPSMKNASAHTLTVQYNGTTQLIPNGTKTFTCSRLDRSLAVDIHAASGTVSNVNGIFEPSEIVRVEPQWQNRAGTQISLTGVGSNLGSAQGGTFALSDSLASYGILPANSVADCHSATTDCYRMSASGTRPAPHWDATFLETLNSGELKTWTLHIGGSFSDVSILSGYYLGIEAVVHKGITAGCGGTNYCPTDLITRAQMAVFLVKTKYSAAYVPAPAIGIFGDVPPGSFGAAYIEQAYRDGTTAGCGGGNYCPSPSPTTRSQMAVFLLKTKNGPTYAPPPACGCVFDDVDVGDFAAAWIEALQAVNGVAAGYCGTGKYCPNDSTTREQMGTFIAKTFGITLYGP